MYVTGGLTPKNMQHIKSPNSEFMKAYFDKGRVKVVLETVPLFAVMVEDLGVRGALKCGLIVSLGS
jgi:glucokinase